MSLRFADILIYGNFKNYENKLLPYRKNLTLKKSRQIMEYNLKMLLVYLSEMYNAGLLRPFQV